MASTNETSPCVGCELKHHIFKALTEEELLTVSKNRTAVVFNKGEMIFKQGTPVTHIVSVTKGLAKIYIEGVNKKNLILQYIRPTEFVGGPGAFVDKIHHYSVIAVEETTACLIDVDVFLKLIRTNHDFAYGYIKDISEKGIFNFGKFITLSQKQMHGRVAEALLYFDDVVYLHQTVGFPLVRKDLADFTSLSKDTISRILNSLADSKIIDFSENSVKIIDRKQLEEISAKG